MKLVHCLLVNKMEWLYRLREMEDQSAGIYIKARASIQGRDKKCPYLKKGLLVCEYGKDEIDPLYLDELEKAGLIKLKSVGNKLFLYLGEEGVFYTTRYPRRRGMTCSRCISAIAALTISRQRRT